jgi:hypothetical protein
MNSLAPCPLLPIFAGHFSPWVQLALHQVEVEERNGGLNFENGQRHGEQNTSALSFCYSLNFVCVPPCVSETEIFIWLDRATT